MQRKWEVLFHGITHLDRLPTGPPPLEGTGILPVKAGEWSISEKLEKVSKLLINGRKGLPISFYLRRHNAII